MKWGSARAVRKRKHHGKAATSTHHDAVARLLSRLCKNLQTKHRIVLNRDRKRRCRAMPPLSGHHVTTAEHSSRLDPVRLPLDAGTGPHNLRPPLSVFTSLSALQTATAARLSAMEAACLGCGRRDNTLPSRPLCATLRPIILHAGLSIR